VRQPLSTAHSFHDIPTAASLVGSQTLAFFSLSHFFLTALLYMILSNSWTSKQQSLASKQLKLVVLLSSKQIMFLSPALGWKWIPVLVEQQKVMAGQRQQSRVSKKRNIGVVVFFQHFLLHSLGVTSIPERDVIRIIHFPTKTKLKQANICLHFPIFGIIT
jgi:hypothetical protein